MDSWNEGSAYESYIGRWSRLVAHEFVAWLGVPPGLRWVDVGCGTGMLSAAIVQDAGPAAVLGIDRSPDYVDFATHRLARETVTFVPGSAEALPVEDASFDAAVSGLMLNFLPDPAAGVAEMRRVTRPGGMIAAYLWDYADGMQLLRIFWDAAVKLFPAAVTLDEAVRFPICTPDAMAGLFEAAGLTDVRTTAIEVPTRFQDFDDYWTPFTGGQGPAPAFLDSLAAADRAILRDRIRNALPIGQDGSIALTARAWAVRGTRTDQ
ncbi:MAG TPA: methyltransferase domain-containing protein [Longimicrobiales bacterium]